MISDEYLYLDKWRRVEALSQTHIEKVNGTVPGLFFSFGTIKMLRNHHAVHLMME
jgi:hypothetical protein